MRVTVVHNYYSSRIPSGENAVVDDGVAALREAGHEVAVVARSNDTMARDLPGLAKAAVVVATGRGASPLAEIRATEPDVVHVHNLFPNLGRTWVRDLDVPLVATLHNFRYLCAAASFFRDGGECYDCLERSPLHAVRHRCAQDSLLQTVPLALAATRGARDPLLARADVLVTLSDRAADLFARAGVPGERLHVGRNFLPRSRDPGRGEGGEAWLFAGRLDETKGIAELLAEWPRDVPLLVVGDGPLREQVVAGCTGEIRYLGPLPRADVVALMRHSRGLVIPSRWVEGFPTVHIEALAAGCPVLAWDPTSSAAFIRQAGGGAAPAHRGELARVLADLDGEFAAGRGHARAVFEEYFGQDVFVAQSERLYRLAADRFHGTHSVLGTTDREVTG